ncbi:MAG: two-component regulator propeller domain-containing protein, partial [Bacteroidota bacterium]
MKFWIAYTLSWLPVLLVGQTQLFTRWEELPEPGAIVCFYEDQAGFMWVGTEQGAYRYDGNRWQLWRRRDSGHQMVRVIQQDPQGRLWFGYQDGGIQYLDSDQGLTTFDPEEGLSSKPITGIEFDGQGRLWFSTYGEGLYFWDRGRLYNLG